MKLENDVEEPGRGERGGDGDLGASLPVFWVTADARCYLASAAGEREPRGGFSFVGFFSGSVRDEPVCSAAAPVVFSRATLSGWMRQTEHRALLPDPGESTRHGEAWSA